MRCHEMRLKLAAIAESGGRMRTETVARPGDVVVPSLMLEPIIFGLKAMVRDRTLVEDADVWLQIRNDVISGSE